MFRLDRRHAGVCIEVIEHLTRRMLAELARPGPSHCDRNAAAVQDRHARLEDPNYLDPLHRGHIVSYSLQGLTQMFELYGLRLRGLPGKSFAFVAEYQPDAAAGDFE